MQFLKQSARRAAGSQVRCAAIISLLLGTAWTTAAAQTVQRCEAADGKVTYSNSPCPDGTKSARQVNTTPPIAVEEQKAAKDRAKRDAADAKDAEKARDKEREKRGSQGRARRRRAEKGSGQGARTM